MSPVSRPNPVRPELVEGLSLLFEARRNLKKNNPSEATLLRSNTGSG
jgi:hypothetical protein